MIKEVIVTSCGNCPFADVISECSIHDGKLDVHFHVTGNTMPENCPLLSSEVTVKVNIYEG